MLWATRSECNVLYAWMYDACQLHVVPVQDFEPSQCITARDMLLNDVDCHMLDCLFAARLSK